MEPSTRGSTCGRTVRPKLQLVTWIPIHLHQAQLTSILVQPSGLHHPPMYLQKHSNQPCMRRDDSEKYRESTQVDSSPKSRTSPASWHALEVRNPSLRSARLCFFCKWSVLKTISHRKWSTCTGYLRSVRPSISPPSWHLPLRLGLHLCTQCQGLLIVLDQ